MNIGDAQRDVKSQPDNQESQLKLAIEVQRINKSSGFLIPTYLSTGKAWISANSHIKDLVCQEISILCPQVKFIRRLKWISKCEVWDRAIPLLKSYQSDLQWVGDSAILNNDLPFFIHEQTGMEFSVIPGKEGVKPFMMSRFPLTVGHVHKSGLDRNVCPFTSDGIPYTNESCDFYRKFFEGIGMSLPTFDEWLHASYCGKLADFYWGGIESKNLNEVVWFWGNSSLPFLSKTPGRFANTRASRTHRRLPVSINVHDNYSQHNAYGMVDMIGNVSEFLDNSHIIGANTTHSRHDIRNIALMPANFPNSKSIHVGARAIIRF